MTLEHRPTTFIRPTRLSEMLGLDLILASETFQHTGSFKFRPALHVAKTVPQAHILAVSSGNFGHALAFACKAVGKRLTVVMPLGVSALKIENVERYGGTVDLVDVNVKSRAARAAELALEFPDAYRASPFDDPLVIEANATLGREMLSLPDVDAWIAPIGGGGLVAGLLKSVSDASSSVKVYGCEPLMANDAARSLREGRLMTNEGEPKSLADGARTNSVGVENWEWIRRSITGIVEVPEDLIALGLVRLFGEANLKTEPTGALPIGALMAQPELFAGKTVCCVITGANVEPKQFGELIGS